MSDPHPDEPPFARTKYVYIAMKWLVLLLALVLALRALGVFKGLA